MPFNFTYSYQGQPKSFLTKSIPAVLAVGIIFLSAAALAAFAYFGAQKIKKDAVAPAAVYLPGVSKRKMEKPAEEIPKKVFVPGNFTLDTVKKKGCVADGMLSGYGDNTEEMIRLIERSECRYLHRALETWLEPPDFEEAAEIMARVDKPGMIFGMFIAESIDKKDEYEDPNTGEIFNFSEMCRGRTKNRWGEHSCVPSFNKEEYRDYIESITKQAMDIGIQSFLFGQIHYQDPAHVSDSELPDIVKKMRGYAKKKNLQIIIGAQTNSITDKEYLRLFDYVEGGVGIDGQGNIEDGPCWSQKSSCWALLWHENFKKNAKNVILNLDWSGIPGDDMSKFARMDQPLRLGTLEKLYDYFTSQNIGFMMPMLAPLYKENGGCYGPKKRFYSPDNSYRCRDEDGIKKITD